MVKALAIVPRSFGEEKYMTRVATVQKDLDRVSGTVSSGPALVVVSSVDVVAGQAALALEPKPSVRAVDLWPLDKFPPLHQRAEKFPF